MLPSKYDSAEFMNDLSQWIRPTEHATQTPFQHKASMAKGPKDWWDLVGQFAFEHLYPIAIQIHSILCNSASSERVWSKFSLIHTKIRNKLTAEKTITLCKIYAFLRMEHIQKKKKPDFTDFDLSKFIANDSQNNVISNFAEIITDVNAEDILAAEAETVGETEADNDGSNDLDFHTVNHKKTAEFTVESSRKRPRSNSCEIWENYEELVQEDEDCDY